MHDGYFLHDTGSLHYAHTQKRKTGVISTQCEQKIRSVFLQRVLQASYTGAAWKVDSNSEPDNAYKLSPPQYSVHCRLTILTFGLSIFMNIYGEQTTKSQRTLFSIFSDFAATCVAKLDTISYARLRGFTSESKVWKSSTVTAKRQALHCSTWGEQNGLLSFTGQDKRSLLLSCQEATKGAWALEI